MSDNQQIGVAPSRPVLRWHGGKWLLAPWIIGHFPLHRVYTEAFGGAGSVLMQKPRAYAEVYNDLEGEAVNLFRVLQNEEMAGRLKNLLDLTPFARKEFELSYEPTSDPVEKARRTVIRSFMGHGSNAQNVKNKTGFRANSNRLGTTPAHDWVNWPSCIHAITERLRGVVIENRDASIVLKAHDGAETLHYVDPPYPFQARTDNSPDYSHEMKDEDHCQLAEVLKALKGFVVLSGYDCPLYQDLYRTWKKVTRSSLADGARARVESLWFNARAWEAMPQGRLI